MQNKTMIKSATIAVILLSAIISSSVSANEASELTAPTAALVSYEAALKKGDLDAAKDLTAKFKTIPAEALEQYTAEYSEGAKANSRRVRKGDPVAACFLDHLAKNKPIAGGVVDLLEKR